VLFPLISLVILLEIIAILSHYDRRKKVLTFVSGILFVIAGQFLQPFTSSSSSSSSSFNFKAHEMSKSIQTKERTTRQETAT